MSRKERSFVKFDGGLVSNDKDIADHFKKYFKNKLEIYEMV